MILCYLYKKSPEYIIVKQDDERVYLLQEKLDKLSRKKKHINKIKLHPKHVSDAYHILDNLIKYRYDCDGVYTKKSEDYLITRLGAPLIMKLIHATQRDKIKKRMKHKPLENGPIVLKKYNQRIHSYLPYPIETDNSKNHTIIIEKILDNHLDTILSQDLLKDYSCVRIKKIINKYGMGLSSIFFEYHS